MLKRIIMVLPLLMLISGICSMQITYCLGEEAVTFSGAGESIEISSDNLFSSFESYLPGDNIAQTITLKNIDKIDTNIYMTMLVANQEEDSEIIWGLIYDKLKITILDNNSKTLYSGAFGGDKVKSHTQGTLTSDVIHLAELKANSSDNIKVILSVPKDLGNEYQKLKAFVIWRFTAEYDTPPNDVDTGDNSNLMKALLPTMIAGGVAVVLLLVSAVHKKLNK